jgi:hypothetical protein
MIFYNAGDAGPSWASLAVDLENNAYKNGYICEAGANHNGRELGVNIRLLDSCHSIILNQEQIAALVVYLQGVQAMADRKPPVPFDLITLFEA